MNEITWRSLAGAARNAAENAYCIYSDFPVGAAVLGQSGRVFVGCNVENASFGLTICAERNAIFRAITDGEKSIRAIVIYTPTAHPSTSCGACRQVIREFAFNAEVISFCDGDKSAHFLSSGLLPNSFGPENILEAEKQGAERKAALPALKPRICIDIDNVIAQTDVIMRKVIQDFSHRRVSLEYDDIQTFNYWECTSKTGASITRDEWHHIHNEFSQPDRILGLEPMPGALENLNRLAEQFMLHFATSRLVRARSATAQWLEDNAFPVHDLHFLKHGEKHTSLGRFMASVEDDPEQAKAFAKAGFGVNFVFAHPWNRNLEESENLIRVKSWEQIADLLLMSK